MKESRPVSRTETTARAVPRRHDVTVIRPRPAILAILLPLAALACTGVRPDVLVYRALSHTSFAALSPPYAVTDVERLLAQAPGGWVGRTVMVQARATIDRTWDPPDNIVTRIVLVDPQSRASNLRLYLRWGSPDPLLATLRRLPVVGRFMPRPQLPLVGMPGIYRVRLCCLPDWSTRSADVALVDADPGYR